jgi:hypothetical protein
MGTTTKVKSTKAKTTDAKATDVKATDVKATDATTKAAETTPADLSSVVKEMKAKVLKANGGKRPLNPVARKSRALKAFTKALENRRFHTDGKGFYTLSGVTVDTNQPGFKVLVDNKYTLALGKGAINELDSYMKLK